MALLGLSLDNIVLLGCISAIIDFDILFAISVFMVVVALVDLH